MQQGILRFIASDPYHLDDLIISSSNQAACDAINRWPAHWGHQPYPGSLLICGPSSCGKTYLTKLWQKLSGAYLLKNEPVLRAEIIKQSQYFIIEDCHTWHQEQALGYFNLINQASTPPKYLLITATNLAGNYPLKDLKSRINSISTVEIGQPDDALVRILIFKLFSINSLKLSNQVLNFLLLNLPRQFNEIIRLVEKINQFSLTHQRRVTVSLAKAAINDCQ